MHLVFYLVIGAASLPVIVALLCRCTQLDVRVHKPAVVVMHGCMLAAATGVLIHALYREADAVDAVVLGAVGCWIVSSVGTWRLGPPEYLKREPRR